MPYIKQFNGAGEEEVVWEPLLLEYSDAPTQPNRLPMFNQLANELYIFEISPMLGVRSTPYEDDRSTAKEQEQDIIHPDFMRYNGTTPNPLFRSFDMEDNPPPYKLNCLFIGARTVAMGWEADFLVKGNRHHFETLKARTGLGIWLVTVVDDQRNDPLNVLSEEKFEWTFLSDEQVFAGFIKSEGGVTEITSDDGETYLQITIATAHDELSKSRMAGMSYAERIEVEKERTAWGFLTRTEAGLGFVPKGSGPLDIDPYAGFATYQDKFLDLEDQDLPPPPANEEHIITNLTITKALREYYSHHVFVDRGNGYDSLLNAFECNIRDDQDWETSLLEFEIGAGSPMDAAIEAGKHGNWIAYFDALSRFNFHKDYCATVAADLPAPMLVFEQGPSTIGQIQSTPAPDGAIVNRVAVLSQWSLSTVNAKDPLNFHKESGLNMGVYPYGQRQGGRSGEENTIEGYMGIQVYMMAASEYARMQQRATVTIKDFPFIHIAFKLYNQIVGVKMKSVMKLYDWSATGTSKRGEWVGWHRSDIPYYQPTDPVDPEDVELPTYGKYGKMFKCVNITIRGNELDAPGGGDYVADLELVEIFPLPADAVLITTDEFPTADSSGKIGISQ